MHIYLINPALEYFMVDVKNFSLKTCSKTNIIIVIIICKMQFHWKHQQQPYMEHIHAIKKPT